MDSIRVKNLRSLKDTKDIELKKINLFVGNNSSGKSTLLRVFPLFKQSFLKKINGPVLWSGGEEDYVDFGSFSESLNYGTQDAIRFVFNMHIHGDNRYNEQHSQKTSLEIAIMGSDNNRLDHISELRYDYLGHHISIGLTVDKMIRLFEVDGEAADIDNIYESEQDMWYWGPNSLFGISVQPVSQLAINKIYKCLDIKRKEPEAKLNMESNLLHSCMNSIFVRDILGRKQTAKRPPSVDTIIEAAEKKGKLKETQKWVLIYYALDFLRSIAEYLYAFFVKVYYITPVRATAERYYTLRNYSVDEVDCRGKNLPIFLNSLGDNDLKRFQAWTLENMGFKITTTLSEGHVSLKVGKAGQSKMVNLSDAGFGYSQILPIITQLWYLTYKKNDKRFIFSLEHVPITIAIEQPELHLHPALQAKLADIIVKIAKENNVRFIIETHSETIINRIGSLIDKQWISNDDVGVYIFDKKLGEDDTIVNKSFYDEEGYLQNWPVGFFEPEEV